MVQENILDKEAITKRLIAGVEHNHPFIISVIGSQLRGLAHSESDLDIGGVFYYTRKNRCSIITKPNTYTVKEVNNTTLIEVKHFFNHLLQHKPTAYELLCSDQVIFNHSIYSPDNLRQQVFKRFDQDKLTDRLFKTAIAFLSNGNNKDTIRGLYFYLYGLAILDAVNDFPPNHWVKLLGVLKEECIITETQSNEFGIVFDQYSRANHFEEKLADSLSKTALAYMSEWRGLQNIDHNEINLTLRTYLEQYVSSIY